MSARKSTRDFEPAATSFDEEPYCGIFKSSLDATRESMLLKKFSANIQRKLRLSSKNEWLDCPGVVKRLGGETEQFPSVVRIALEAWLQPIPETALKELEPHYNVLVKESWVTKTTPKRYKKLLFDGSLLFSDRIEALRQRVDANENDALNALKKNRECTKTSVQEIWRTHPLLRDIGGGWRQHGKIS